MFRAEEHAREQNTKFDVRFEKRQREIWFPLDGYVGIQTILHDDFTRHRDRVSHVRTRVVYER